MLDNIGQMVKSGVIMLVIIKVFMWLLCLFHATESIFIYIYEASSSGRESCKHDLPVYGDLTMVKKD